MKKPYKRASQLSVIAFFSILISFCSSSDKLEYDPENALLLRNVAVFDASSGIMNPSQDVLIEGEKIIAIRPAGSKLEAAESIDCTGKYVIPGLCDSHTHLSFLTPQGEDAVKSALAEFVHRGVLYARDVGGPTDVISQMKSQITSGQLVGPEIFYTGPMFESSPLYWAEFNKPLPGFTVALDTKEDVDEQLPALSDKGARLMKTFNNIKPDLYPYIVEIAQKNHLKIVHDPGSPLYNWVPIHVALELGITTIEHAKAPWPYVLKDEYREKHDALTGPDADPAQQAEFLAQMAELGLEGISEQRLKDLSDLMIVNNAVFCPTLRVFEVFEKELKAAEEKGGLTEELNARKKFLTGMNAVSYHFVKKLSEYGVEMLVGHDDIEPVGTLEEMVLMKEAGVTDLEVLRGATIYAAEWLEVDNEYGTVEPDKFADLVVLDSNPLDDIANVYNVFMVIQHGKIVKN
jgi:hypothetical protein